MMNLFMLKWVGEVRMHLDRREQDLIEYPTAIEAIEAWRTPMFGDIFHETGNSSRSLASLKPSLTLLGWIVTTCGEPEATKHLRQSYENLVKRNGAAGIQFVETPEDIIKYVPQLKDAKDLSKWKGLWNKQVGWAHAAKAMTRVASEVSSSEKH